MGVISELFGYVLNALYNVFNNYGIAIIIFSVLLRILIIPITLKQQKSLTKNSKIQKELKTIQLKYKNNPEEMNKATMELYKSEGISPFSGCLSGILQIIIILAVFWLVSQPLTYMKKVKNTDIYNEYKTKIEENSNGRTAYREIAIINAAQTDYNEIQRKLDNKEYVENTENSEEESTTEQIESTDSEEVNSEETEVIETKEYLENRKNELETLILNMQFLGLDLSKVPTSNLSDWKVLIIPILYVITSFISIRMTTKMQVSPQKDGEDKTEEQANMDQMNKSMSYMMPIMSVSIAAIAPLGLALYWLVSNVLMIIERLIINKIIISKEEKENV